MTNGISSKNTHLQLAKDRKDDRDEKIYYLKEEAEDCINVINAFIEIEKHKDEKHKGDKQ